MQVAVVIISAMISAQGSVLRPAHVGHTPGLVHVKRVSQNMQTLSHSCVSCNCKWLQYAFFCTKIILYTYTCNHPLQLLYSHSMQHHKLSKCHQKQQLVLRLLLSGY